MVSPPTRPPPGHTNGAERVSVIVPTYNRDSYIAECLDSLLAQSHPATQVIVVDDGSTDATPAIVARYGTRVCYLHKENGGKSAALNFALPRVTGDFVWVFDDDDVAMHESLALRLAPFRIDPQLGFVYSSHYLGASGSDGRILRERLYELPHVEQCDLVAAVLDSCFFSHPSLLVRTECYREIGGFNEAFARGQDYEMTIRLAVRYPGAGIADPTLIVRRHDGPRGPASSRHAHAQREKVWLEYERQIGRNIRDRVELTRFLPASLADGLAADELSCRTYLARAGVMAGKGLLAESMADLLSAADTRPNAALSAAAAQQAWRIMTREFVQLMLEDGANEIDCNMPRLATTVRGRSCLRALAHGQFWAARQLGLGRKGSALKLAARLGMASFGA